MFRKTKKLFGLIAAAAMTAIPTLSSAQSMEVSDYTTLSVPTSQTWKMVRYGSEKPSLNTGAMTASVPIFTYSDPDFTIPISLDYAFDGYRPAVHSGPVGMGWRLNCGGVLTRTAVGLPDEISSGGNHGYLFSTEHGIPLRFNDDMSGDVVLTSTTVLSDLSQDLFYRNVFNGSPVFKRNDYGNLMLEGYFDTSSDIYHFTYPGGDGRFVILPDGQIKVYDASRPFGEISATVVYNYAASGVELPEFTIDTGDGYRYMYGGDITHSEYNADAELSDNAVQYSSLTLKKIVAPNGRRVEFIYSDLPQYELSYQETRQGHYVSSNMSSSSVMPRKDVMTKYFRVLTSVKVDGRLVVRLNYDEKDKKEFARSAFGNQTVYRLSRSGELYDEEKRLSSIVIFDKNRRILDIITLGQSYTSDRNASPKMFLNSVSGNMGEYTFTYHGSSSSTSYPTIDCTAEDHWGFWRGTGGAIPVNILNQQDESLYDIPSDSRNPVLSYTLYGALTTINYPTGGYSVMDYEQNDAGMLLDRNTSNMGPFLVSNATRAFPVGGVRVRSISSYNEESERVSSSRFTYCNPEDGSSSGILMQMRRYVMYVLFGVEYVSSHRIYFPGYENGAAAVFSSDDISRLSEDSHIAYSHVQEHLQDGSWTDYGFYNWQDAPDVYSSEASDSMFFKKPYSYTIRADNSYFENIVVGRISPLDNAEQQRVFNIFSPVRTDYGSLRGRLKEKTEYSSSGDVSAHTIYRYGMMANTNIPRFCNMMSSFLRTETEHLYIYETEVENTTYDGGVPLTVSVSTSVNNLGQKELETTTSGDLERSVVYTYAHEGRDWNGLYRSAMSCLHKRGENGETLSTITFGYVSDNPKPTTVTETRDGISRTTSIQYDSNFRPVRINYPGGRWTQYLWSADGRYLLGSTSNDTSNSTSYTWQDLVGLTSVTLPSGQSESYTYDSKGRLSERKDSDGTSTQTYQYHLNNE